MNLALSSPYVYSLHNFVSTTIDENFSSYISIAREVNYLKVLRNHENIVNLIQVFSSEKEKDVYLIFEYVATDLYVLIRSQILEDIHIQFITYQLLVALKYVHGAGTNSVNIGQNIKSLII